MINKIIIDNFMAHEHTELEFGPGLTILTGGNNTGKSAVVEALRCLSTNPTPKHYIRHGAKEARITAELDDGTKVVWVRKKRSSGYELWAPGAEEPEEYWKFGRRPPEDIRKALRLDMVDLETGGEVDIHVGNQREPVFLLNQPPSNAAAFFAASTESAHLLAMQNLLKRKTTDAKREARGLEADLARVEGEIDQLADLPDIALQMEDARLLEQQALELERTVPQLEGALKRIREADARLAVTMAVGEVLDTMEPVPPLADVDGLKQVMAETSRLRSALNKAEHTGQALAPLAEPPKAEETRTLAALADRLEGMNHALRKVAVINDLLQPLESAPELDGTGKLSVFIDELITIRHRLARLDRWTGVLRNVVEPPSVEPVGELVGTVGQMQWLQGEIAAASQVRDRLDTDLRLLEDRIGERIESIGSCPTCGHRLTREGFLDHGGCHEA